MSIICSSVFSVIVLVAAFCNVDAEIVIAPLFGIFFGVKLKVMPVEQVDSKASGCAMSAGAQIKVTDDPLNKYLQPKSWMTTTGSASSISRPTSTTPSPS